MTSKKEIEHNYNVMFKANDKYWRNKHAADIKQILELIDNHEKEAELKAEKSLGKGKFIMYGYWKAIAVHMRKIKRELKKKWLKE